MSDNFPWWPVLGLYIDDPIFVEKIRSLGNRPLLQIVEHTADLPYFSHGLNFSLEEGEWLNRTDRPKDFAVVAIHVYTHAKDKFKPYTGSLPLNLDKNLSRDEVRKKLGVPESYHEGGKGILGLKIFPWDKFKTENGIVHVQYLDNLKGIDLITIMRHE